MFAAGIRRAPVSPPLRYRKALRFKSSGKVSPEVGPSLFSARTPVPAPGWTPVSDYSHSIEAALAVEGRVITGGRVLEIAPENPRQEVSPLNPDVFKPQEHALVPAPVLKWRFPARSVSVVELDVHPS